MTRWSRFAAVFGLELRGLVRRPMFWILSGVLGLLAWGLSTGSVMLGTGSAMVGGRKAWVSSEFSSAFVLSVLGASIYSFFVAIASGLSVQSDDEAKVSELLHSTRLTPGEYVWAKASALVTGFALALALHLVAMVFFNHVLPNPGAAEIRGPFAVASYLRPALVFTLPTIVFFAGVAFWLGETRRRAVWAFVVPIAFGLLEFSLFWNFSPGWLEERWNRLLMLLDPSGFRWLNETWIELDRGADFYNTVPIGLDGLLVANRLLFLGLGLLGVALAHRHLARTLRRAPARAAGRRARAATPTPPPAGPIAGMRVAPPGFVRHLAGHARAEIGALAREPALYLFAFFILLQTLGTTWLDVGPFDAPVLLTPGLAAVGTLNTLSLLVCLLMMFFFVESLERERATGLAPMVFSAPGGTGALLAGKIVGNSVVALGVLGAVFLGCAATMLIQGQVAVRPGPFLLVWGLLLLPTLLAWSALLAAVQAVAGNRYVTYGAAMGLLAFTLYRQLTGQMSWLGNWLLWDAVSWSDASVLELDRRALVLNRLFVLALAVFFFTVARRLFQRRRVDDTRLLHRLRPRPLLAGALRLAPAAAAPLALGTLLWVGVLHGHGGEAAESDRHDYWARNLATWRDAPQPSIATLELDLVLEPAAGRLESRGTLALFNHHDAPLERFAVTTGRHWRDATWTLGGEPFEPDDRSLLMVFTPHRPLAPGATVELGFAFHGRFPDGVSKNGGPRGEFVLPGGVVLSGFGPSFLPVLGYDDGIGVDDDNRADPPEWLPGRHNEVLEPLFGSQRPFTTRVAIDVPAAYEAHSVGARESERVEAGRRKSVWVSDHPVRLLNVVAGRWQVERGDGTAVYYFPEHRYNVDRISRTLEASRRLYSEWFRPFPWRELRISEFPALAAYGQGFPTNITFSEGIGFLTREDVRANVVALVTAHEAAHQWWGNLLTPGDGPGGNVLSEGLAHFSTALLIEALEGERARIEFARRTEERYGDRRRKDAERPLNQTDMTQPGDRAVVYDRAMLVFWMLMEEIGREAMLAGLGELIDRYGAGPDYPLVEDLVETLRPHAPDPARFQAFADQWIYDVAVPELRLAGVRTAAAGGVWTTEATIENAGTGRVEVEVAAVAGDRWTDDDEPSPDHRDARVAVTLAAGESRPLRVVSPFEPDRLVVDPDVRLLQLRRKAAVAEL